MRPRALTVLLLLTASGVSAGPAAARVRALETGVLAMDRILSPDVQPLYVTLPSIKPGEPMEDVYTGFGKDVSPPVAWDGAPPDTHAFVLIMQDADAPGQPAVHWLAYNIPGTASGVSKNMRNRADPHTPAGTLQGMNFAGGVGYIGPKPPVGDPPHRYHIQVFALDRPLPLKGRASLDQLIAAMDNRVMAEGEAVATFAAPQPAARLTPQGPAPQSPAPQSPAPPGRSHPGPTPAQDVKPAGQPAQAVAKATGG